MIWYPLAVPTIGEEEIDAAVEVLRSGHTTMGDRVEAFEEQFARYVGANCAVMVNSGSSADLLMAFADEPGEVLIPAVTWPTHVWSFHMAGYKIRFVDVDGVNTTPEILQDAITPNTVAISVPHLMGIPVDVVEIGKMAYASGLSFTEDCCEALGASFTVGLHGRAASWSFFFSHQMTTMEGGMVTTDDRSIARKVRSMRSHGWSRAESDNLYEFIHPGFNVRPLEITAAIGSVQLPKVDDMNRIRVANLRHFKCILADSPVTFPLGPTMAPFGIPFFVDNRDDLASHLASQGVETRPILGGNLLNQPAFSQWNHRWFAGAERVDKHGLFIGVHPTHDSGIEKVAGIIGEFLE